jgi:glutamine---fructose-6-phosphate transaminase (isomerizing)
LKLMETSYVVAERFSSADLLHGPIAMLETAFPAFLFCPPGVTWKPMSEMLGKLREIGAESLVITDEGSPAAGRQADPKLTSLTIPANLSVTQTTDGKNLPEDVFTPIPYIIPAQLFAAKLAEVKHLDPDRPRTLSKVTQTL